MCDITSQIFKINHFNVFFCVELIKRQQDTDMKIMSHKMKKKYIHLISLMTRLMSSVVKT